MLFHNLFSFFNLIHVSSFNTCELFLLTHMYLRDFSSYEPWCVDHNECTWPLSYRHLGYFLVSTCLFMSLLESSQEHPVYIILQIYVSSYMK